MKKKHENKIFPSSPDIPFSPEVYKHIVTKYQNGFQSYLLHLIHDKTGEHLWEKVGRLLRHMLTSLRDCL